MRIKKSRIYDPACRRLRLPVVMSPPSSTPMPNQFIPAGRTSTSLREYLRSFYRRRFIVKSKQTLHRESFVAVSVFGFRNIVHFFYSISSDYCDRPLINICIISSRFSLYLRSLRYSYYSRDYKPLFLFFYLNA